MKPVFQQIPLKYGRAFRLVVVVDVISLTALLGAVLHDDVATLQRIVAVRYLTTGVLAHDDALQARLSLHAVEYPSHLFADSLFTLFTPILHPLSILSGILALHDDGRVLTLAPCAIGVGRLASAAGKELGRLVESHLTCLLIYTSDGALDPSGDVLGELVGIVLGQVGELSLGPRPARVFLSSESEDVSAALHCRERHTKPVGQCAEVASGVVAAQDVVVVLGPGHAKRVKN